MAGPKPWTDNFGIEPRLKSCVIDILAHFLCLQERSAPVPIQLVIHQPMSEVFRRFSFGVLKRCHQVYPFIFPPWRKYLKRKLWSSYFVESIIQGSSKFHHTSFFPVVLNATGLRLGTWIGTSPCPRHKGQKKSLLQNLKGTSCPRPAATPGSVARELRLWKHHNKNYDTSWLKLASITIELLTISAIS